MLQENVLNTDIALTEFYDLKVLLSWIMTFLQIFLKVYLLTTEGNSFRINNRDLF